MKKKISGSECYYTIAWSPDYQWDKYNAIRIVPELAGIVCLMEETPRGFEPVFFYSCWRDGLRIGLKKIMDEDRPLFPVIFETVGRKSIRYRYTEVDTTITDMQDIMFWLIQTYEPRFNSGDFPDSHRYTSINVHEIRRGPDDVVEKIR